AARVEDFGKPAVLPEDQRRDRQRAGHTVGDPLAAVTGVDVDVVLARVASREGHEVDRLHDLPGPAEFELAEPRVAPPGPFGERGDPRIHVARLPAAVVLAANDEPILAIAEFLQS